MFPNYGNRGHRGATNGFGMPHWNLSEAEISHYLSTVPHATSYDGMFRPLMYDDQLNVASSPWEQPCHASRPAYFGALHPPFWYNEPRGSNSSFVRHPHSQPFPQGRRTLYSRQRVPHYPNYPRPPELARSFRGNPRYNRPLIIDSNIRFQNNRSRRRGIERSTANTLDNTYLTEPMPSEADEIKDDSKLSTRSSTPNKSDSYHIATTSKDTNEVEHSNLREKLIDQLRNATYQCLICISRVRQRDQIWSCSTCFHIYHLSCIKLWSEKCRKSGEETQAREIIDSSWRCPACQTAYNDSGDTLSYFCFCRRVRNPEYHPARSNIPHSCDEVCGKLRSRSERDGTSSDNVSACTHPCTELCHPGPCPPCSASVTLSCPCGRNQRPSLCGERAPGPCGRICQKKLPADQYGVVRCVAGVHSCLSSCHDGPCPPCSWVLEVECYCGLEHISITCGDNEAQKVRLNEETLNKLEVACAAFNSILLEGEMAKLNTSDFENESVPVPDQETRTAEESEAEGNSSFLDTPNEGEYPQALCTQPLKPDPVSLGACFSCGKLCGQTLNCGHHTCPEPCHKDDCKPCALDPSRCFTCPCGRVALSKLVSSGDVSGDRTNCSDPVPTCPNVCGRPHPICGHPCPEKCHLDSCPPCTQSLTVKCRCGRTSKELTCTAFTSMADNGEVELSCERPCNKKKACGRHKCKQKCCGLTVHPCGEVCGRRLSCGKHNCEEPCHSDSCGTCWRGVIYTEITCRCGFSVLHPPQPCGSGPPECPRPCDRPHACDHPVRHTCHNEPTCPPCTVLLTKECPGGHGVQFSMPCFQPVLSCGHVCGHPLPNCSHFCQRLCHTGGCLDSSSGENEPVVCTQPCQKPRPDCGHPCALPCHEAVGRTCLQAATLVKTKRPTEGERGSRVATLPKCRHPIDVVCPCGRQKDKMACHQAQLKCCMLLEKESSISTHLGDMQKTLQISLGKTQSEPLPLLACDNACTKAAVASGGTGNSRYADTSSWTRGLDLNPENSLVDDAGTTDKLPFGKPEYSDWLRNYALHNFAFAVSVERQFYSMVVQLLKASDPDALRTVTHHFPPMKEKRRRFIHELSEFYGIESHSLDPEPGRHVMVLARRGSTKFPGGATDHRASLTGILQREFPRTVKLAEGIRVPAKTEPKLHAAPTSTTRSSYAQILSTRSEPS